MMVLTVMAGRHGRIRPPLTLIFLTLMRQILIHHIMVLVGTVSPSAGGNLPRHTTHRKATI